MATPHNHSETIRCGVCGKTNPAAAAVCAYCGARLRPSTPPTGMDNMDSTPTGPLQEPEPDFMFGHLVPEEPTDMPDSSQPGAQTPLGGMPEWLSGTPSAPRTPSQPFGPLPDWLGAEKPSAGEPPAGAEVPGEVQPSIDEALSWLTDASSPPGGQEAGQPGMDLPEEGETPGWLSELSEPTPESPAEDDVPEWLRALSGAAAPQGEPEPGQPQPDEEVPGWLSELGGPEEALPPAEEQAGIFAPEPVQEPPGEPSGQPEAEGVPGWLAELDLPVPLLADEKPIMPAPPAGEPSPLIRSGMPDWLQGAGPAAPPPVEPPTPPAPVWLGDEAEAPARPEPAPELEEEPVIEEEVPAWLADLAAGEPEVPEHVEAAPTEEVPLWLADLAAGEAPAAAAEEPAGGMEEAPAWLAALTAAEPQTPAEAAAPAEPAGEEVPEWFGALATEVEPAPPPPAAEILPEESEAPVWPGEAIVPESPVLTATEPAGFAEPEMPDWMAALGEPQQAVPSGVQPVEAPEPEPAAPMAEAELDWLDQMFAKTAAAAPAAPLEGEDLLGLSGDIMAVEEAEKPVEEEISQLPTWLHVPEPVIEPSAEVPSGYLQQIQELRYSAITGHSPDEEVAAPETVGALRDVTGVIRPELLFEASSLTARRPIDDLVLTEGQVAQVKLVEKLLAREEEGVTVAKKGSRAPVLRWLIAAALIAAVVVPLVFNLSLFGAAVASPGVASAYETLDQLGADPSTVLVAFEYEAEAAGELQPLAEAVVEHLASIDSVTVYTISSRPAGPAMAEAILHQPAAEARLASNGGTWVNLGYISGQANGINALAIGSPPGVPSPLSFDYLGQPTGFEFQQLKDSEVEAIVVVSAQFDELRAWIEQAGVPTGIPMVAAVSAAITPLAHPYETSGQLLSVISGINDAVAYRQISAGEASPELLLTWNAQALGSAAAALLIVLGGIVYGISSLRDQQEQQ